MNTRSRRRPRSTAARASPRLLKLKSLRHLALRLDLPVRLLEDVGRYAPLHYEPSRYRAKKDTGAKPRELHVPKPLLKRIQRRINQVLLADLWLPDSIHSYRRERSTKTAALPHAGQGFLWHGDIRDFYPSISHVRVYKIFTNLGCSPDVARVLTQLTTYRHRLPQGAPTSPGLANAYLMVSGLAARLEGLARKEGLSISLFGDDILVSSRRSLRGFEAQFKRIVTAAGLRLHSGKTLPTLGPDERHMALGILMNSGDGVLDVPRSYRREVKSLIRLCQKFGPGALAKCGVTNKDPKSFIVGKIGYAVHINPRHRDLYAELDRIEW